MGIGEQVVRDGVVVQALATNTVISGVNPLGNRVLQVRAISGSVTGNVEYLHIELALVKAKHSNQSSSRAQLY